MMNPQFPSAVSPKMNPVTANIANLQSLCNLDLTAAGRVLAFVRSLLAARGVSARSTGVSAHAGMQELQQLELSGTPSDMELIGKQIDGEIAGVIDALRRQGVKDLPTLDSIRITPEDAHIAERTGTSLEALGAFKRKKALRAVAIASLSDEDKIAATALGVDFETFAGTVAERRAADGVLATLPEGERVSLIARAGGNVVKAAALARSGGAR